MAGIQSVLKIILPKDKVFYSLFQSAGKNLELMGLLIVQYILEKDPQKREKLYFEIEQLEHDNDDVTHELFRALGKNFITPFDREDIHTLSGALDDVADYIYATTRNLHMHNLFVTEIGYIQLAQVIQKSTEDIAMVIAELKNIKNPRMLIESLTLVNEMDSHAEGIFDEAIQSLFQSESDFKQLILKREILMLLEQTSFKCKEVAQILKMIVLKSA